METISVNAGRARKTVIGGREFLVAPMSLLTEGVLSGSQGPIFYPAAENAKNPDAWNGMPILLDHPYKDNQPISGRSPDIWDKAGLGHVYNAKIGERDKLQAEGFFDVERVKKVDPQLLQRLESGQPIELSTGVFVQPEPVTGNHNGKDYVAVARDLRPDHLAILPYGKGACSVKDGCGVNVNAETTTVVEPPPEQKTTVVNPPDEKQSLWQRLGALLGLADNATKTMGGEALPKSAFGYTPSDEPSTWKLRIDDATHVGGAVAALGKGFRGKKVMIPARDLPAVKRKVLAAWKKFHPGEEPPDVLTANAISHDELRCKLCELVEEKFGPPQPPESPEYSYGGGMADMEDMEDMPGMGERPYVVDVFDKDLIYSANDKLWRVKYSVDLRTNTVSLSEEPPTEVTRQIAYKPVVNQGDDRQTPHEGADMPLTQERKKAIIDELIANCEPCKHLGDGVLAALPDDRLEALQASAQAQAKALLTANAEKAALEEKIKQTPVAPAVNATAPVQPAPVQPITWEHLMSLAPADYQATWNGLVELRRRQKEQLTDELRRIAESAADQQRKQLITEELAANRDVDALQRLLILVRPAAPAQPSQYAYPIYAGGAIPVSNRQEDADADLDMLPPHMRPVKAAN